MATKRRTTPARKSASGPDAIALLKKDHEKVRGLLSKLEKAAEKDGGRARQLATEVEHELKIHTTIEEEIFYPAFRDAVRSKEDKKMYFEALEEHHVVDVVLPEAVDGGPASPEFAAKAKVLKELVEHHADEEEKEMFPKARKAMGKAKLEELGARMKERKTELGG